jgi:hypothetical protein
MSRSKTEETHNRLAFFVEPKLQENLRIRLYYDGLKSQTEFFRVCVESYLAKDKLFMEFLDDYRFNKSVQSKKKVTKSRNLRLKGEKTLRDLALTSEDIENIFDILEEELPEL